MRRQPQTAPPAYWMALCTAFLRTSDQLALELWEAFTRHYCWRVATVRYCLDQLGTTAATVEVWQQRTEHFEEVLPARDLLALGQRISPEGRKRRADVVQFEETLLRYMSNEGTWR